MGFLIGQKVVCLRRKWRSLERGETGPSYETVYTIRTVSCRDGKVYLRFNEILNPKIDDYVDDVVKEARFWGRWFRPVTEKQTDITAFTEILNRENKNSRVPVSNHQSN